MTIIIDGTTGIDKVVDGSIATVDLADGAVTQAKLSTNVAGNGPAFSAVSASTQNPTSGIDLQVVLGTEEYDTANAFSANAFTAPVAGYYLLNAQASCASDTSTSSVVLTLKKNGTVVHGSTLNGSFGTNYIDGPAITCLLYLAANDVITFFTTVTGTGATRYIFSHSGAHPTRFSGFLARAA